jgi:predicted nucleic acid-binding Zn ribbon protein
VREPQSAGDALQRLLERLGLDRQLRTYRALMHWDAVVGVHLAQVARPLRVDADTLWVAVKSHAWVQELTFHKRTILQRLNAHIGEERFREVRFTVRAQLPTAFQRQTTRWKALRPQSRPP